MKFSIDQDLLKQARQALSAWEGLYWIVGGAGSGKTAVCQALATRSGLAVYDMDAQIYGNYHERFSAERHPANWAWARSGDGLAWLLEMSWEEFDSFNQAALPEYLDLLAEDLGARQPSRGILIDGGVCNPAILAQVIPNWQIACLTAAHGWSTRMWEESDERQAMKAAVMQLPNAEAAWRQFLAFDEQINATIFKECLESEIAVCLRDESDSVEEIAGRVGRLFGLELGG